MERMEAVPKEKWPEWIKERLKGRKNIGVKKRNGNFYLYEHRNVWDKKLKRPRKTTRYVGVLRPYGGRIYEHGHVAFLIGLLSVDIKSTYMPVSLCFMLWLAESEFSK